MLKRTAWSALTILVLLTACHRNSSKKLGSDPADRESYGLGFQLGTSLKKQNTAINLEVYVSGLRDALAGVAPQVSEQEIRTAVLGLRKKAVAAQQASLKETSEKNRSAGQAFLEANAKREGVQRLPGGLQYKVLKEGTGNNPKPSELVTVNYRGTTVDGTEFANSFKQNKPVTLAFNRVIPGWREALPLMKVGSRWQLFVPSGLAYGQRGGPGIEPNSTLLFEVELLRIGGVQTAQAGITPVH